MKPILIALLIGAIFFIAVLLLFILLAQALIIDPIGQSYSRTVFF